jgi:hypothetical protein
MKTLATFLGLAMITSVTAFGQNKVDNDPSYSAYNYKHPNKAAYAKEHNLDNPVTVGTIEVTENENYKQSNSMVTSNRLGVVSVGDKDKVYPNYKRQHINLDNQNNQNITGEPQIADKKKSDKQKDANSNYKHQGRN